MKNFLFFLLSVTLIASCTSDKQESQSTKTTPDSTDESFQWQTEQVADLGILRYQVHGFDKLTLNQKQLVYSLAQAGLAGRDIMYDQNYRYNLDIRKAFEKIMKDFQGDRNTDDFKAFITYLKRMWFSNGIHHHYSNDKFSPEFSREFLTSALKDVNATLSDEIINVIFDPSIDNKKVSQDASKDLVLNSAVNFYGPNVTQKDVENYYAKIIDKNEVSSIWHGLNNRLIKDKSGELKEEVYSVNGKYGAALQKVIEWLDKARDFAENKAQGDALGLLIQYYQTGDLKKWDEYNIAWLQATEGDIDYINGFIEVYNDPMGYRGSYETIVQIKDFDASARMQKVSAQAQWFESNSPIMDEHKKKDVKGITYNVVTVASESGDASPSTPIGVNLPNSDWIRKDYGSKSVSLGNITEAYEEAAGPGLLNEFSHDEEEIDRAKKHGKLAGKIHTALHEVIGHASGQLEKGVGTPKETLKNYASPLEEARADLVSLYFITDPKLVALGLMESLEVGKAAYDNYLKNGYMLQLRRIEPGNKIEQAHMRNRQMISSWAIEQGLKDGAVEIVKREDKTFIEINDYEKLRAHFGTLLREVQRLKSQGDYEATKALFETYGVQVNPEIHQEVLARSKKLNIPPYWGFINPELELVKGDDGQVKDVEVNYPMDFAEQMMRYGEVYSHL
jgi:dipeptidyl-peptidase-3